MATNNNPDLLYLPSRETLLLLEDTRLYYVLQTVANYYLPRNDQPIWGALIRAIAQEMARLDYDYQYDIVATNPQYLTPPDIKRRFAAPLHVSSVYPYIDQFDKGDFSGYDLFLRNTVGYRDMLVDLIKAYGMGATAASLAAVVYAYTGKSVPVVELYTLIGLGVYDQSDRNTVTVGVNIGGSNPLVDIENLSQLSEIIQSLYGALDLAKPAHVGLELTTVFVEGEDLQCALSPRFLTAQQFATMSSKQRSFYALIGYVPLPPSDTITLSQVISLPQLTIPQYEALQTSDPVQAALYEAYYQDLNCTGAGINDIFRIIIPLVESSPLDPMLWVAPIKNVLHPKTTLAAYGRMMANNLTPDQWHALQLVPIGWDPTVTYHRGNLVSLSMTSPFSPSYFQYRAGKSSLDQDPTISPSYWKLLLSPAAWQAYYLASSGFYVLGIASWAAGEDFYTGQFTLDPNGNLQIATQGGTASLPTTGIPISQGVPYPSNSPTSLVYTYAGGYSGPPLQEGMLVTVSEFPDVGSPPVPSLDNVFGRPIINLTGNQTNGGTFSVAFKAGMQLQLSVSAFATAVIAFASTAGDVTDDGTIIWTCLGSNYLTDPSDWIAVVSNEGIPDRRSS